MSGPAISDEMVEAFARGFNACPSDDAGRHPMCCTRAGLAAALVASGWRPEADVLREAADHFAAHWYDRGQAVLIARELRNHAGRATALEPVGAPPVAGSFGVVVHEQTGIKGTSKAGSIGLIAIGTGDDRAPVADGSGMATAKVGLIWVDGPKIVGEDPDGR